MLYAGLSSKLTYVAFLIECDEISTGKSCVRNIIVVESFDIVLESTASCLWPMVRSTPKVDSRA